MYKRSTEIKVGLFVLLALALFGWMAVNLGGLRFGSAPTYSLSTVFPNVGGLKVGVAVEVAGIRVGTVTDIALYDNDQAQIFMAIQDGVRIPADSAAVIRAAGILGDKYVEIKPGSRDAEELGDQDRIQNAQLTADLTDLMDRLGGVADDLKALTGAISADGGGEDVRDIIRNFKSFSERLDNLIGENEAGLGETMASLRTTMNNLSAITDKINAGEGTLGQLVNSDGTISDLNEALSSIRDIADKISSGYGTLGKLVNSDATVNELDSALRSISDIAAKISAGEGTLGRLVNDEATIDQIDTVLTGIGDYLEKDQKFKVYVDYRADYLIRHDYLKSTVNLRLQPAPDHYYLVGVTSDYFGEYSRTDYNDNGTRRFTEQWERGKLKFNAQIAKRYYDLVLRGGLIESGAGLGVDYYLFDEDLLLTFEGFSGDFDYNPHLRVMASYNLWKIFYVSLGYDDFISDQHRASPFFGLGIRFSDDDLKYLLSGASSLL